MEFRNEGSRSQPAIRDLPFHEWAIPDGTPWTQFFRCDSGYLLRFPDLADFLVSRDGRSVCGWAAPGVEEHSVQHLYRNQVLPLALSRQGKLVFHASAVELGGAGIALVGESGRGKSTLAASFATNGSRFLADDGLAVEFTEGAWRILPSHPSLRLWEDSQQALMAEGAVTAPPEPYTSKSRFVACDEIAFCGEPRRLHRVYFLGSDAHAGPKFERLRPGEALIELLRHSFLLDLEERELLAAQFDELSRLAALPIYFRLDYPRRYEELAQVRQAIIVHVHTRDAKE